MHRSIVLAGLAAAAIALALQAGVAAGEDGSDEEPQVVSVELDSYGYTPKNIIVKVNRPVLLRARSKSRLLPHNLIVDAPEAGIDVDIDLKRGGKGEALFTPTKTGTYVMYCDKKPPVGRSHRERGMEGTLVVED